MSDRADRAGSNVTRRDFLKSASVGALGFALGASASSWGTETAAARTSGAPFLAIQTHAHDYLLEGVETVCRNVRERGGWCESCGPNGTWALT